MNEMQKNIFEYILQIPKGYVTTYKQIAIALGNKNLCRVVGNILHKNPDKDKYPCYKVVSSKGRASYSYAFGGILKQTELLKNDGIIFIDNKVDLNKYLYIIKN